MSSVFAEVAKIVGECRERLKLQDWTVQLEVSDEPSVWYDTEDEGESAAITIDRTIKHVQLWISPARTASQGDTLRCSVYHEMLHIMLHDVGITNSQEDEGIHSLCFTLANALIGEY